MIPLTNAQLSYALRWGSLAVANNGNLEDYRTGTTIRPNALKVQLELVERRYREAIREYQYSLNELTSAEEQLAERNFVIDARRYVNVCEATLRDYRAAWLAVLPPLTVIAICHLAWQRTHPDS